MNIYSQCLSFVSPASFPVLPVCLLLSHLVIFYNRKISNWGIYMESERETVFLTLQIDISMIAIHCPMIFILPSTAKFNFLFNKATYLPPALSPLSLSRSHTLTLFPIFICFINFYYMHTN